MPLVSVSWHDAMNFCAAFERRWISLLPSGFRVTLPTEIQWEYAARAGTDASYYAGESHSVLDSIAWYAGNSLGTRHPVCEKLPNQWGLYDMIGNVWQWCLDAAEPYPAMESVDWMGRRDTTLRAYRGCSFMAEPGVSTLPCVRGWLPPEERLDDGGFRLCLTHERVLQRH